MARMPDASAANLLPAIAQSVEPGTLQGAVRFRNLDCYLDEFTLRFNRHSSKSHGLLLGEFFIPLNC